MALISTKFFRNKATVAGGAVFAGYLEAIRLRDAPFPESKDADFLKEDDWKALSVLAAASDLSPFPQSNWTGVYGDVIGTFAVRAELTVAKTNNTSVETRGDECVIDRYRSGDELPSITVQLVDGLGQGPARSHTTVKAVLSSAGNFLHRPIELPMDDGGAEFSKIEGYVRSGSYQMTISFTGTTLLKSLSIRVIVKECSIGEVMSKTRSLCVDCSSTSYNFHPEKETDSCEPCPEHGSCENHVITPNDGYWHKTPCSRHLQRCLTSHACEFKDRSKKLQQRTEDLEDCALDDEWIANYTQAQCAKVRCVCRSQGPRHRCVSAQGHKGPLCGSCEDGYSSGLSSKCRKCMTGFINVVSLVASALFLVAIMGVTIGGTLSVLRTNLTCIYSQRSLSRDPNGLPATQEDVSKESPSADQF